LIEALPAERLHANESAVNAKSEALVPTLRGYSYRAGIASRTGAGRAVAPAKRLVRRSPIIDFVLPLCAAVSADTQPARDEFEWHARGHVGVGIASAVGRSTSGRTDLDASFEAWTSLWPASAPRRGERWTVFGGSFVTGFGAYPTYASLDLGIAYGQPLIYGATVVVGPAARVDPSSGVGFSARVGFHLWILDVGVRFIAMANDADAQVALTLGVWPAGIR